MSTQLNLTSTARFSAEMAPRREPRDLTAAVVQLTLLQNPSRIEPATRAAAFAAQTFGRRSPQAH